MSCLTSSGSTNRVVAQRGLYATFGISPDRIADVVAYALDLPDDTTVSEFTVGPAKQPW
jgi:NADP-dependent 3-hydroxy acid dehydrogenase YdfG